MASILTRAGKGSPLSYAEVDANFNNLNNSTSRLDTGQARQLLQTNASATGIEWTDDISISGTLSIGGVASFAANVTCSGTGAIGVPSGTEEQRPGTPATGMVRFNSTSSVFEGYNGSAWGPLTEAVAYTAGNGLTITGSQFALDTLPAGYLIVGDGSNVATSVQITGDVLFSSSGVTSIGDGVIVDDDISDTAEIAVSKLADGLARQILQTDAAGTGVEWTSNLDIPGTLDVTDDATFDSDLSIGGSITSGTWAGNAIAVNKGGTGQTTYTSGQLLIGKTDGSLAKAALTAGTGISISNGDGSVTVAVASDFLTDPVITGCITEDIYTISDVAGFEVDPGNGSIQLVTLGANRTPKATNFANGESVTLMVDDGLAYTISWGDSTWGANGLTWVGGSAPTLAVSGYTVIQLWKVGNQVYGATVGDVA